ncbi:MAG: glycosyltransferase [Caldilineaceae bacterium]|nr:glycosyltransferase [Caldilineaceae bacterium]
MRVVFFWEAAGLVLDRANPYAGLLARALGKIGVEMVAGHAREFTEEWVRANQGKVNVLHLNWLHLMYDAPDLPGKVARAAAFINNLTLAHRLGYKIVWTVHNLYPHESQSHELDHLVRVAVANLATAIIAHCEQARSLVEQHFHRTDNVVVIAHGHFIDIYPNSISRSAARQQLGIAEENFVYLFFGNVRPYKGLENLLHAFKALPGEHLTLLLAAKVYNDYGDRFVEEARGADPRILVCPSRFFANEEFQLYFNAADVSVLPFLDVLTSGSTITALSFGLPVIVPPAGCLRELVDERMGILYDQQQPDALQEAMLAMQQRDLPAARQAAYARAQSLAWDEIARLTLAAYHSTNRHRV